MAEYVVIERVSRFVVRVGGGGSVMPGTSSSRVVESHEYDSTDRLNLAYASGGFSIMPDPVGDCVGESSGRCSASIQGPVMHGPLHSGLEQPERGSGGRVGGSASVRSGVRVSSGVPRSGVGGDAGAVGSGVGARPSSRVASLASASIGSESLDAVASMDERRRLAVEESLQRWSSVMGPAGQLHRSIDDVLAPDLVDAVDQLDRFGVHDAARFVLAYGPTRCLGLIEWVSGRDDIRDPAAVIASKLDLRAVAPKPTRRVVRSRRDR